MKLSLTLLVIFGLVAFIGAAPVEDEPEVPEPSEADAPVTDDAPEEEQAQDEDDISDDDASNEDDDEDEVNPMGEPDEDPRRRRPRPRPRPVCCKFPFKSTYGCYKGKCYQCCSVCKHKVGFCSKVRGFCRFERQCKGKGKKRHCHYVRRCYPAKFKCYSLISCLSRKCQRVRRG